MLNDNGCFRKGKVLIAYKIFVVRVTDDEELLCCLKFVFILPLFKC